MQRKAFVGAPFVRHSRSCFGLLVSSGN
jgi:hypothetical protein